jgi:ABC-type multidrug transport system fused ATPase/permease subunit
VLFDDPLSAVDPGIAAGLWQSISRLTGKTRLIVTHALHFLPSADFIITLQDGHIAEQGTYAELKEQNGAFARLIKEFANEDAEEMKKEEEAEAMEEEIDHRPKAIERSRMTANVDEARKLMQVEKMNTGGMKAAVYTGYMRAGKGWVMLPLLILSVIVAQAFTLITSFWLVWWQERRWNHGDSFYEGVYAALGIGSAVFLFAMGATQGILSYFASVDLYRRATLRLLKAPMSFYDTNPLGRILNRMSKDR